MKFSKYTILSISLLVLFSCHNNSSTKTELSSNSKENLLNALEAFNTAFAKSDLQKLDSMTTENYLHTNSSSQVITKNRWFNYLRKRDSAIKSGQLQVLSYSLEDEKVELFQNSAIVTGKVKTTIKDSSGIKKNQYRITNIWILDQGEWKRAGFHDGKTK